MNGPQFIRLTQRQVAIVDAEDFESLSKFKWHAKWNECTQSFYAARTDRSSGSMRTIRMHRIIIPCSAKEEIDHINHDTLDNRRSNLRRCSKAQNQQNSRRRKDNKSGFKGVSFHRTKGKWAACISHYKQQIHLGYFPTPKEAGAAYVAASKFLHGQFSSEGTV